VIEAKIMFSRLPACGSDAPAYISTDPERNTAETWDLARFQSQVTLPSEDGLDRISEDQAWQLMTLMRYTTSSVEFWEMDECRIAEFEHPVTIWAPIGNLKPANVGLECKWSSG
jgi:hypothetical protein